MSDNAEARQEMRDERAVRGTQRSPEPKSFYGFHLDRSATSSPSALHLKWNAKKMQPWTTQKD